MIEPAEIRRIVREEIASLLAQERSHLLAEIRQLLKTTAPETESHLELQAETSEAAMPTADVAEEDAVDGDLSSRIARLGEPSEPLPSDNLAAVPAESQPTLADAGWSGNTANLEQEPNVSAPEPAELLRIKELLAQKQALEAELESLALADDTDDLLNAFADRETPAPPVPPVLELDPAYDPHNPWFLGIDIDTLDAPQLHLCLANGITGHTYPLTLDRFPPHSDCQKLLADLCTHWSDYVQHPNPHQIFQCIHGVILSAPSHNFDEQSLRLRQLVLQSGLQVSPESILVIERGIAPLLAVLHRHPQVTDQHLYVRLDSHTTSCGLTGRPAVTATIEQGAEHLELAIAKHLFPIITEEASCLQLTRQCHQYFQAHGDSPQWQYAQLSVSRVHYEQARQQGLAPWLEQLNHQINIWLSRAVVSHVWLMAIPPIIEAPLTAWLQLKLPHAHLEHLPITAIAEGLSVAPFHRSALDIARLQYSDYFLLNELCALRLPDVFDAKLLWQSLHQRGVNIRVCGDRLQAILDHGLPSQVGLAIGLEPKAMLFQSTADGRLSTCRHIIVAVRSYLQQLQYELKQNLTEPLVFPYFRQLTN